jgi:hypothetical protein
VSFQEVTMYRVICDGCGVSAHDGGDFYAWADKSQAEIEADSSEWMSGDGGHWCPRCIIYDEARDEYVPKPGQERR